MLFLAIYVSSMSSACSGFSSLFEVNSTREATQSSPIATKPSTEASQSKTADEVEQAIAKDLPKKIGVPVKSVSCPDQEKLQAGQVFECKAEINQGTFLVRVTVKDTKGHLNFKTRQLLVLSEAEKLLQQSIKKNQGMDVKADCGSEVRLFTKVGDRFDCKLTDLKGKTGTATITVVSQEGKVDAKWKL